MDFDSILKGYSAEQYTRALLQTTINFLDSKGIIDNSECMKYINDNIGSALNRIVKYDKEENKRKLEENKRKLEEYRKSIGE